MSYPDYWPNDNEFQPIHNFLHHGIGDATLVTRDIDVYKKLDRLAAVQDVMDADTRKMANNAHVTENAVLDQLSKNQGGGHVNYTVAELDRNKMWKIIEREVTGGPGHSAGYKQDKYAPARWIKGTPAGPGTTKSKTFREVFGQKRMSVNPGQWQVLTILVCKNAARWQKFETCRQNFRDSRVRASTQVNNFKAHWAIANRNRDQFPVIDPETGECWLWSGQSLDIYHGILSRGFQRLHCASNAKTGYGALGRGNYFTDKFSKALLYAINLRNQYFGSAKGEDIRVLMLSRVLLGEWRSFDGASSGEMQAQRFAHNVELTASAQQHRLKQQHSPTYEGSAQLFRDWKVSRAAMDKGWRTQAGGNPYQITGQNRDENIGYESLHMSHKGSNEFLVAIGKQVYPEFIVFVHKP